MAETRSQTGPERLGGVLAGLPLPKHGGPTSEPESSPSQTNRCQSFDSVVVQGMMARGGFPKRHAETRWKPVPAWLGGWSLLLESVTGDGGSLSAIVGGRGVGKTQMATSIARVVCVDESSKKPMKDTPAVYDKAMGIFVAIRQAMKTDEGEASAIRKYVTPRLLVIDEIQERGETEWEDRVLTHIIDKRYDDPSKHTVIVGNCTPESAAKALGSSVVSRIKERGQFIVCDWPSFR